MRNHYRVRWEIDVAAGDARSAAVAAKAMQVKPDSTMNVFEVSDQQSTAPDVTIDLDEPDAELEKRRRVSVVLAGLRLVQALDELRHVPCGIEDDILTDGGTLEPLDADEIDELCERLNCFDWLDALDGDPDAVDPGPEPDDGGSRAHNEEGAESEREYAFEIRLTAVARVRAENEQAARCLMDHRLADADLICALDRAVRLTEAALDPASPGPDLVMIDGKLVD